MQNRFIDYIRLVQMANDQDSILLGVSGGIDSMVMLSLFQKSGLKIAVAHCNFSLRGDESDGDEQFVKYYCLMNGIMFHSIKFDTKEYAHENKLSIQVAARELRYGYFDELCKEYKYSKIAIAHNLNDSVETVLLNLTRGTGIKGLTGIKPINGKIIRPLLFATRKEIESYAVEREIKFREDSSNSTVKYKRNFIRHRIIPELANLNPSVLRAIADTAIHLQDASRMVDIQIASIRAKVLMEKGTDRLYSITALMQEPSVRFFLIEELGQYGFSPSMAGQAIDLLHSESGKRIESETHVLLRDREYLILSTKKAEEESIVTINSDCRLVNHPINLNISIVEDSRNYVVPKESTTAALNLEKLVFPLTLRRWQPGDRFIPFGMDNYKKVSDFLIDQKVPLTEKDNIFVLESGSNIVWVVGYRIDNRFRINNRTKLIWVAHIF